MGEYEDKLKHVNLLLGKIGKIFFLTYLKDVLHHQINYSTILATNKFSIKSIYTRVSNIRKLIYDNSFITALEICSKSANPIIRSKSLELLETNRIDNLTTAPKQKTVILNSQYQTRLTELDDSELIKLYSDTIKQMKDRNIIRSSKVTGDLGEHYVVEFSKISQGMIPLTLTSNKSNRGYDATDNQGNRYEIKTITQYQTSNIQYTPGEEPPFDYLVICKLDSDFLVENIYKLTFQNFIELKSQKGNQGNIWVIKINNSNFIRSMSPLY